MQIDCYLARRSRPVLKVLKLRCFSTKKCFDPKTTAAIPSLITLP